MKKKKKKRRKKSAKNGAKIVVTTISRWISCCTRRAKWFMHLFDIKVETLCASRAHWLKRTNIYWLASKFTWNFFREKKKKIKIGTLATGCYAVPSAVCAVCAVWYRAWRPPLDLGAHLSVLLNFLFTTSSSLRYLRSNRSTVRQPVHLCLYDMCARAPACSYTISSLFFQLHWHFDFWVIFHLVSVNFDKMIT